LKNNNIICVYLPACAPGRLALLGWRASSHGRRARPPSAAPQAKCRAGLRKSASYLTWSFPAVRDLRGARILYLTQPRAKSLNKASFFWARFTVASICQPQIIYIDGSWLWQANSEYPKALNLIECHFAFKGRIGDLAEGYSDEIPAA